MLEIKEDRLKLLLNEKKNHIRTLSLFITYAISLAFYIITVIMADFMSLALFQKIAVIIGFLLYGFLLVYAFINRYSVGEFYDDISKLSAPHNFSLIVFKDVENKPFRFLMKYDKRWHCYLFPYIRTRKEDNDALDCYINHEMKISEYKIEKNIEEDFTKFSYSANMTKTYHHSFYFVLIDTVKENMNRKSFKMNGDKYKWFSLDDLKANKKIMKKNSETILFVETHY